MIPWLKVSVDRVSAWASVPLLVIAQTFADSPIVRNIIAVGAAVAALGVVYSKIIKPAFQYAKLPDRVDSMESAIHRMEQALELVVLKVDGRYPPHD